MVDFAQLRKDMVIKSDAQSRARGALADMRETWALLTEKRIPAVFEYMSAEPVGSKSKPRAEAREIPVRVEMEGIRLAEDAGDGKRPWATVTYQLSDSPYYNELINQGAIEDDVFSVDVSEARRVIKFKEAVTGYESFALTPDFVTITKSAINEDPEDRFYICAGTRGRWDACSVRTNDVLEWMKTLDLEGEVREALDRQDDATPTP